MGLYKGEVCGSWTNNGLEIHPEVLPPRCSPSRSAKLFKVDVTDKLEYPSLPTKDGQSKAVGRSVLCQQRRVNKFWLRDKI